MYDFFKLFQEDECIEKVKKVSINSKPTQVSFLLTAIMRPPEIMSVSQFVNIEICIYSNLQRKPVGHDITPDKH